MMTTPACRQGSEVCGLGWVLGPRAARVRSVLVDLSPPASASRCINFAFVTCPRALLGALLARASALVLGYGEGGGKSKSMFPRGWSSHLGLLAMLLWESKCARCSRALSIF